MKGFLFVFNSKEYKKSENVVVCISNSKSLTARFAKAYAKIAKENFNKNSNLLAWWGTIYPQFCFMEAPRTENGQKAEPRFHFWIVETLNALM